MKQILYIGDLRDGRRSAHIFEALQSLDYEIKGLSDTPVDNQYPNQLEVFYHKVRSKLGYPADNAQLNPKLLAFIRDQNCPDLIWIHKGSTLRRKTIEYVKYNCPNTPIVYYTNDNMLKSHNITHYIEDYIPLVDIYYTVYRDDLNILKYKFNIKELRLFHYGYSSSHFPPRPDNHPFVYDVVFTGYYEEDRFKAMLALANAGINVTIYGNGWDRISPSKVPPTLNIKYQPVWGSDQIKVMHESKIALNFFRQINNDVITDRAFEIPATGTFMLSERTDKVLEYFAEGQDAEFFASHEELIEKAKYYLENDDERNQIAKNGLERCRTSAYSYTARMQTVLSQIDF